MATQCAADRQQTIENNMGLVHACAHRFKGRGIEYDDLFQAGCIGLCKAVDAFDTTRGVRFSTYAVPVILGEMRRLFRDGGSVKISRGLKELSMRVARRREQMAGELGRSPTIGEIALDMDMEREDVVEAICAASPTVSLTGADDDGGGQIDIPVESPEDFLSDVLSLKQSVGALDARDRSLIILRYFCGKTQVQTAQKLGMTQVQVSRREKKLLQILRRDLL